MAPAVETPKATFLNFAAASSSVFSTSLELIVLRPISATLDVSGSVSAVVIQTSTQRVVKGSPSTAAICGATVSLLYDLSTLLAQT